MVHEQIRLSERQVRLVMTLLDEGKDQVLEDLEGDIINFTKNGTPIRPRTLGQKLYVDTIRRNSITFGIGPAGTGKTYLAVALAAFALKTMMYSGLSWCGRRWRPGKNWDSFPGICRKR